MYTIWPEMSLDPPEVNRKLARNSPEYINGIHLGRNEFEYFTASSRDRFLMNYFFGVSTFSANWYFEKLSLLSYGLKFENSKFDLLASVTWFGLVFIDHLIAEFASESHDYRKNYLQREQLICIVIWAYQCTRWNRFKLVCTSLGKIDPAIFRI